jgi:hypothetical protein
MDSWKKYIQENEDRLSIEEVDDRVWQHVSKAVPKKSFINGVKSALDKWYKQFWTKKEGYITKSRNHQFKWAFASILFAFIIVSCTYKVKSYATYGSLVSFAIAKNSQVLSNELLSKNILNLFSYVISPSDSSSFLFFKYFRKNNPKINTIIANIKEIEGISELAVTPVVFEYKESLFSSLVSKALDIQIKEAKPDNKQLKNTVKVLLKERGLNTVDVQIEANGHDILIISKPEIQQQALPVTKDLLIITDGITDSVKVTHKIDTAKLKEAIKNLSIDMPNLNRSGWKKDLDLTTELTKALEKEGFVDNKNPYKLEIKDGEFYINDKKQSKEVTDKFRKYFKNDNYTIINDGGPVSSHKLEEKPKDKRTYPGTDIPIFDPVQYKKDLKLMNQLIDGLHEDGLIDRKKPYTVQVKEGELYIDSKKQPKEVSDKFRKYFQSNNYGFMND